MDSSVGAYSNVGTDTAASFQSRFGDGGDGMQFFGLGSNGGFSPSVSDRGLLAVNNEYIIPDKLHANGPTVVGGVRTVPEEVRKEFYAQGVSIAEIRRGADNTWTFTRDSAYNRRIDTVTDIVLSGPAGSTPYMVTKHSTDGSRTRGTVSNCAHGHTPWGTYLSCEENWAAYFRRIASVDNPKRTAKELASLARYGVAGDGRELWATVTPDTADALYGRWNAMVIGATARDDFRNAPNTLAGSSRSIRSRRHRRRGSARRSVASRTRDAGPRRRRAEGRSSGTWAATAETSTSTSTCQRSHGIRPTRMVAWRRATRLDNGRLYAAKFNPDGSGVWIELAFGSNGIGPTSALYPFADQSDVLINARLAADTVGATRMDRPEWGAVDPMTGAVYMTLTNNTTRTLASTDAANPRHYADRSTSGTAMGQPERTHHPVAGDQRRSDRVDVPLGQLPVRRAFDRRSRQRERVGPDGRERLLEPRRDDLSQSTGICWISTDDGYYTDVTNCMTLAALPGFVGDGTAITVTNTDAAGATKQVQTSASYPLGSRLKRFLVGPIFCEMSGITESPDGRALFVNVMHPGGHWPDGGTARPRSATVVITRDDGGVIGV